MTSERVLIRRALAVGAAMFFLGVFLALAMSPLVLMSVDSVRAWYDKAFPPSVMSINSVQRVDETTIRLRFNVTRKRPCTFTRMVGFSGASHAEMEPAQTLRKADSSPPIDYPVGITVLSPAWLMSPIRGPHIVLYGHYNCDGRVVPAVVIDEVIPL